MKVRFRSIGKRLLTGVLSAVLVFSGLSLPNVAYAATMTGSSTTVLAPGYNAANIPAMDTTGTVAYWYAGNKFLALNQFNNGADSTQASKSITIGSTTVNDGTMDFYNDATYGYRGIETNSSGGNALQTTLTVTSTASNTDKQTYIQAQGNSFFDTDSDGKADVWELMDSDAVWDDDYLFSQYRNGAFEVVTSSFTPDILTNIEKWYDNGFSYTGGGASVSAQGSYFSDAEKNAVKSATITTDGINGSSNTSSSDTITAHLFAPSVDEIFYNPQQVASIWNAFSADSNAGRTTNTSWQYPRSHLWLRSFWGVRSVDSRRRGVIVYSTGTLGDNHVAHEFAVAPAFYLDTKGVVMAKDASNAAASAAASASKTLGTYSASAADDNKSVKFLISDPTLASSFTTSADQKSVDVFAGDTYTISYSGADTSADSNTDAGNQNDSALVISAIIYDTDGKILYYGPLSEVTSASGSVDLEIPALADGTYTLAVFEEQLGGTSKYSTSGASYTSYESDYQSGAVSYSKLVVGSGEGATGFDAESWYSYTDTTSGIVWKYKLDANGDVIGLYTESSSISGIIDSGKCLNVPAKINGRTVVAIGGESSEHPFIPASQKAWTSISFPSTLTTINDYAFLESQATAKIVIPSNITAIGVKAFYDSNITQVVLSEFNGRIGSYAFANTANLSTVTIKGGEVVHTAVNEQDTTYTGLLISSACFADSALTALSITGNVTINKKAFVDCTALATINLNGNIRLNENVFSGCTSAATLYISGTVNIGSYAFNGCTALENVFLPVGTIVNEYSFNGCSGIKSLEADCNLPSHSFEGTGNITLIILDQNCLQVNHDWEGNSTSFAGDTTSTTDGNGVSSLSNPGRTVYARNAGTHYVLYGKGGTYLSPFGASGTVQVFVPYDVQYNTDGSGRTPDDNGLLALYGITFENYSTYDDFKNAGGSTYVNVTSISNIDTMMSDKGITALADSSSTKTQTGINAYYSGTILTTKDIDKDKMTVTRMYGAEEGGAYTSADFYVVRTSEFNTEKAKEGGVTEENIAAYEPVSATAEDLTSGQTTGTISATVVVFYSSTSGEGESAVTTTKYFSTPVSIRVEEYSAKSYIEQVYGSYDAVAAAFVEYENRITALEKALAEADVDSVDELSKELAACKAQYAELVEALAKYVSENTADSTGYFGTTTNEDGTTTDVVFIEGNGVEYNDTGKTDESGNKIYTGSYDVTGDGNPETIYFTVSEDGISLVDSDGNPVKADGTEIGEGESGTVYTDKLGALQRQLTAQITDLKSQLDACDEGVTAIKKQIEDSGIDFSKVEGDTDYEKIANVISALNSDIADAETKIANYATVLNAIYNKLSGEDLSAEDAADLEKTLNLIQNEITTLQQELEDAKTRATTAEERLAASEEDVTDLTAQLREKQSKIDDLQTQVDALSGTAKGYTLTIAMANSMFGSDLSDDASAEDIANAVNDFVKSKTDADATIAKIQALVGSTATGDELVEAVSAKIGSGSSGETDYTGYTKDTDVNTSSASYTNGYNVGYAAGVKAGESSSSTDDSKNYSTGYSAGYAAGVASVDTSANSSTYKNGYNAGYAEGLKKGTENSSSTGSGTNTYNDGYNAGYTAGKNSVNTNTYYNNGFNAGVASVDTSSNSSTYKNGYTSGYAAGASSVDTSSNSSTYKNGYSAGYAAGRAASTSTSAPSGGNSGSGSGNSTGNSTGGNGSSNGSNNSPTQNKPETTDANNNASTIVASDIGEDADAWSTANIHESQPMAVAEKVSLGTVVTRSLPTASELSAGEVTSSASTITYSLNEKDRDANSANPFGTNAASFSDSSTESRNKAYKIIEYYRTHPSALANLGYTNIADILSDDTNSLDFDVVESVDITPNNDQIEAMKEGKDVDLKLVGLDENEMYLIIHESTARNGEFDVLLAKATFNSANGGEIDMVLPDLSPVTVTKLSVSTTKEPVIVTDETQENNDSPSSVVEEEKNGGGNAVLLVILLILAAGVLVFLFIMIKKRGGFDFKKK